MAFFVGGAEMRASWPAKIQERLAALEELHRTRPHDRDVMVRLARFLVAQGDITEALKFMRRAGMGLVAEKDGQQVLIDLGVLYLQVWKEMRATGGVTDIYIGEDRSFALAQANSFFHQAFMADEVRQDPAVLLQAALAREMAADFPEALSLMSSVIMQHQDHELLPYAMFRAAVILHHLGNYDQSRDYLEYLSDAELPSIGVAYSVYYAELILLYQDMGATDVVVAKKVASQLRAAHMNFHKWFIEERQERDDEGFARVGHMSKEEFQQSHVAWADLSVECLGTCDYLLAVHFLTAAVKLNPHPDLILMLAQALWMVREPERANRTLEQAAELHPGHEMIAALLKRWAPASRESPADAPAVEQRSRANTPATNSQGAPGDMGRGRREAKGPIQSSKAPPKPYRKKITKERSLFAEVGELEVHRIVRRAFDNHMGYVYENDVLRILSDFAKHKTKYEVANVRMRLKKKGLAQSESHSPAIATLVGP